MKNTVKLILMIILMRIIVGCTNKDTPLCCAGDDTLFEFSLINRDGLDLLDENITGSYNTENIRLYDLVENDEYLINNPNSDYPKGYSIIKRDEIYRIRPSFSETNKLSKEGIIEWSVTRRDTIFLEMIQQSEDVKRLVKVKYNNEVVWDENTANADYRYFQIVK
ncbi:MAG: hypothetical protein GY834_05335 [Bacteroidetes bacterium]|nr:hypothetical protein [Bacteroidota bacterium]